MMIELYSNQFTSVEMVLTWTWEQL